MTRLTHYSEAFWGLEYTSTAGYDALSKHNSEQKKFLHDCEEYLRKRSKIEMDYGKALGSLTKNMKERSNPCGVLEVAWNTLRGELENCKQAHDEAGMFFTQHAEETKRFSREVTARRDNMEDRLKKIQSQKASLHKSAVSLSKTYGQKCREKDQTSEAYKCLKRGVTSTIKELEKGKSKMEKSEEEACKADNAYKTAVTLLEETRQEWEKEMEGACQEFQSSDEEQITFLRSEMWLCVNRVSQTALEVDDSCERVRKVLETCNVDQDIQNFIAMHATGTQRPEAVTYQNYYDPGGNSHNGRGEGGSPRLPMATPASHDATAFYSIVREDDDPTYASADPAYSSADPTYSMAEPLTSLTPRVLTVSRSFQVRPPACRMYEGR
ncbi:hypothetical protein V1264_005105 [Littorina saxatilis]|uniref:F-BAR domain-containing protein n=1 Tax=Littorina saxatilis TaxID=31220 RepID=A0AAN9G5R5_9CAEN